MPEWARDLVVQVLVGAGGLALFGKGVAGWWTRRVEKEKAEEEREKDDVKRLRDELRAKDSLIEGYQAKLYSLLVDAATAGKEDTVERARRLATDDKLVALIEANISALTRFATSRQEKGGGYDSH